MEYETSEEWLAVKVLIVAVPFVVLFFVGVISVVGKYIDYLKTVT